MIVGTMLGKIETRPLTTGGLRAGDLVGMTRHAGLEGTAILHAEYGDRIEATGASTSLPHHESAVASDNLLVADDALRAAACRSVSALHDVTEGGVGEAIYEMAVASGLTIDARRENIPVLEETAILCNDLGLDPLGLIGSGSILVGCSEAGRHEVEAVFEDSGVPFAWIGRARSGTPDAVQRIPRFPRDELLKTAAMDGVTSIVFDMDGTLVNSTYDWPEIRRRLGVTGSSIIDDLNGLQQPERDERWAELEALENAASEDATLHEGVHELLDLLAAKGITTALVTNNTDANTKRLIERFDLHFNVVLTRDSGFWKPSGAPVSEAVRRLGTAPEHCLGVGDSRYDVLAAREAGLKAVCVLHDGAGRHSDDVDLAFDDIPAFIRYLEIVLP
jgi:HAD superfamily hydrolase (TIGR01509 family)